MTQISAWHCTEIISGGRGDGQETQGEGSAPAPRRGRAVARASVQPKISRMMPSSELLACRSSITYQFGTLWAGAKVALLFIGIRVADEAFLQPVIARHSVHLHPMVFLLALVLGGEIFGFLGLVFAIPAACIIKALIKVGWSWYASESGLAAPYSSECEAVPLHLTSVNAQGPGHFV